MIQIKPPTALPPYPRIKPGIFLAGSIEQGAAEDWQAKVVQELSQEDVYLYNPRRDFWDASLEQSINNATFRQQVEWELDALKAADWIIMYFDPATKSPVTLLEFGLMSAPRTASAALAHSWLESGKLIVACPHGFWRRGNLEVCCARAGMPLYETLDELLAALKKKLQPAQGAVSSSKSVLFCGEVI